jgi:hypothetical protein
MNMTSSCRFILRQLSLVAALALAPAGGVGAWQAANPSANRPAPPVMVAPPPGAQFRQTVQQQQTRDELQKSQLEQQLQQQVSDNAKRPGAAHPGLQQQLDHADRARRDRDRAAQQDRLDRYQRQARLPRVVPQPWPASPRSGGPD